MEDLDIILSNIRTSLIEILALVFTLGFFVFPIASILFIGWLTFTTVRMFPKLALGHRVLLSVFWILASSSLASLVIGFIPWALSYRSYFLISAILFALSIIGLASLFSVVRPLPELRRGSRIFIFFAPGYSSLLLIFALVEPLVATAIVAVLLSTVSGFAGAYFRHAWLLVLPGVMLWVLGWYAIQGSVAGLWVLLPAILFMASGLWLSGTADTA